MNALGSFSGVVDPHEGNASFGADRRDAIDHSGRVAVLDDRWGPCWPMRPASAPGPSSWRPTQPTRPPWRFIGARVSRRRAPCSSSGRRTHGWSAPSDRSPARWPQPAVRGSRQPGEAVRRRRAPRPPGLLRLWGATSRPISSATGYSTAVIPTKPEHGCVPTALEMAYHPAAVPRAVMIALKGIPAPFACGVREQPHKTATPRNYRGPGCGPLLPNGHHCHNGRSGHDCNFAAVFGRDSIIGGPLAAL
jgi:hypothetical protein